MYLIVHFGVRDGQKYGSTVVDVVWLDGQRHGRNRIRSLVVRTSGDESSE